MLESILILGLTALLPVVYLHGKRVGFERHNCRWVPAKVDQAPAEFVAVACRTCGEQIPWALHVRQKVVQGRPAVTATVDAADLEHHQLTHAEIAGGRLPESAVG